MAPRERFSEQEMGEFADLTKPSYQAKYRARLGLWDGITHSCVDIFRIYQSSNATTSMVKTHEHSFNFQLISNRKQIAIFLINGLHLLSNYVSHSVPLN